MRTPSTQRADEKASLVDVVPDWSLTKTYSRYYSMIIQPCIEAAHPRKFFERLPVELWLHIVSYLGPIDRRTLMLSSREFYAMWSDIMVNEPMQNQASRDLLLRRLHRDWYRIPGFQRCIRCDCRHERILAQRRTEKPYRGGCARGDQPTCRGGLRLTADLILCQVCWTDAVMCSRFSHCVRGKRPFRETWDHEVEYEWRGKNLILTFISSIDISFNDESKTLLVSSGTAASSVRRQLADVTWCGCLGTDQLLLSSIMRNLRTHFLNPFRLFLNGWKEIYVCKYCSALYVTQTRLNVDSSHTIKVSRLHNLSDLRVYAARNYPAFCKDQFWQRPQVNVREMVRLLAFRSAWLSETLRDLRNILKGGHWKDL